MRHSLSIGLIGFIGFYLAGCTKPEATTSTSTKETSTKAITKVTTEEHGHKPSSHGGILVSIGKDNYHAEAVFEKGGFLRLYMLGQDESQVQEIEAHPITAYVKVEGDTESVSFILRPEPQTGDKEGMTSQFLGHLPKEMVGKKLDVTIPNLQIGKSRFRLAFKSVPESAHTDISMPNKLADNEEKKLFLTAAGKYTDADVKANGSTTPSVKFKGIRPTHDADPKPGEKICPISETKANPKFNWTIGGKSYEFCCLPCIEEFVVKAKESPETIQEPSFYIKK